MAELIAGDGTRFPLAQTEVLVGRRGEDGRFRPDVDLADLFGGRSVSRRHLRLSKTEPDTISITVADSTGEPVASVGSLLVRAVSAQQLSDTGGTERDALYGVDWTPIQPVSAGELLRRTLRVDRQNRTHRPHPDLRRTAPADRPHPIPRPLQRPAATPGATTRATTS